MNKLASFLIFTSLILFLVGSFLIWQRYTPSRLSFDMSTLPQRIVFVGPKYPIRLVIQKLDIDLPIYPAQIKNGNWEATTKGVSYLSSSVTPGSIGNSIIYGHNFRNLLGNLVDAEVDDEVNIYFSDGGQKSFNVKSTSVVYPDNNSVLSDSKEKILTIYTCTGFLDSKRFVVTATLQ